MSERFEFALEKCPSSSWHAFERLARVFMANDYQTFRNLAAYSGDGGRDGMLFLAEDDESVAVQVSVSTDWAAKIHRTQARLRDSIPNARELIYLTNQDIGARADSLRRSFREGRAVRVDIRDRSWFVDREHLAPSTTGASEAFCHQIVDPLLPQSEVFDRSHAILSNDESRAALLYLAMQSTDDSNDRQLTKLCFDSLVRTALRQTTNENRMGRPAIYAWVLSVLPTQDDAEVRMYVDRALERLNKTYVRRWVKEDNFCLSHDERTRIAESIARILHADEAFDDELRGNIKFVLHSMELDTSTVQMGDLVTRVRRVFEQFLFERGESFVTSIRDAQPMLFAQSELADLAKRDANLHPDKSVLRANVPTIVAEVVERAVSGMSDASNVFVRMVGDAYTLFAFMCETPNVQSAVSKLFSQGEFWLDTSAVLPLLVESLLDESERRVTTLMRAVVSSGAKLNVTNGVVDELLHHIELSLTAWRAPLEWHGRAPFLYSSYLWSGSRNDAFSDWLRGFRGDRRPEVDLAEYLFEVHGIRVADIKQASQDVDDNVRWHASEYWRKIHENRRPGQVTDPEIVRQLAERDLENFLGVLGLRSQGEELHNAFGYRQWWISPVRSSIEAAESIREATGLSRLDSPVLDFAFLSHYLAVGPARRQLAKSLESRLPMMVEVSLLDATPAVLLELAESIRSRTGGMDERVVRREIRDRLEGEKLAKSRVGRAGPDALVAELRQALEAHGRRETRKS